MSRSGLQCRAKPIADGLWLLNSGEVRDDLRFDVGFAESDTRMAGCQVASAAEYLYALPVNLLDDDLARDTSAAMGAADQFAPVG